jgi:hypothetical protein
MTAPDDPWMVDAIWRATDLTRAYLDRDRALVAACLTGLDTARLERVLSWLSLDHDDIFDMLGEPSMGMRTIDALAALAPPEIEFATTTAVRRVAAKEVGVVDALEALALLDRVHALAICTAVLLLEGLGHSKAREHLDEYTADYERMGHLRLYTIT